MTLMCMARLLCQGVKGQLCCAGSATGAVRAQSLDGDGGSGEGPLLGANITCRQGSFSCHVHSCRTPYQDAHVSDVSCQQLMTIFLRPIMAGHDVGMIDYRGKQLTLIGGPLLDPFSASFQGERMLPGAEVMQRRCVARRIWLQLQAVSVMASPLCLCCSTCIYPICHRTAKIICMLEEVAAEVSLLSWSSKKSRELSQLTL